MLIIPSERTWSVPSPSPEIILMRLRNWYQIFASDTKVMVVMGYGLALLGIYQTHERALEVVEDIKQRFTESEKTENKKMARQIYRMPED